MGFLALQGRDFTLGRGRVWGLRGRADFVLFPPTLSAKWALNPRRPIKAKTVPFWEARILWKEKVGSECACQ